MTKQEVLSHLGCTESIYKRAMNFLGINWHVNRFTPDSDQLKALENFFEVHKNTDINKFLREQNCLKKYGYKSANSSPEKRKKSSITFHKNLKENPSKVGFCGRKGSQHYKYKTLEEKQKTKDEKEIKRYGELGLSKKEKDFKTRSTHHSFQGDYAYKRFEKHPENYSKWEYGQYFKYWLIKNHFLNENDFFNVAKVSSFVKTEKLTSQIRDLYDNFSDLKKNTSSSLYEDDICDFLKSLNVDYIRHTRKIIAPKELDIYIPSKKVAIEFNGLYWHSLVEKDYHLNKTLGCEKLGIRLVHIFEDDWISKRQICESIISSALGIYKIKIPARRTTFCEVPTQVGKEFCENNHLHGALKGGEYYGLEYNEELIQVIQIGFNRFSKEKEIELYRMCTKLNTQVLGGFSKLLKHQPYNSIISYVDRSLYNGSGYVASGWKLIGETKPAYSYWKNRFGENRLKYQKHKLSKLLEVFDKNKTEKENMEMNGYSRIYDCGNLKLMYKKR